MYTRRVAFTNAVINKNYSIFFYRLFVYEKNIMHICHKVNYLRKLQHEKD